MKNFQKILKIWSIFSLLIALLILCFLVGGIIQKQQGVYWCPFFLIMGGISSGISYEIDRKKSNLELSYQPRKKDRNYKKRIAIWIVIIVPIFFLLRYSVVKSDEECKGYYFRNIDIEPIVFQNAIYFPDEWDFEAETIESGNIKKQEVYNKKGKFKNPIDYMYYFFLVQLVYVEKNDTEYEHLYITGGRYNEYSKVSYLEDSKRMEQLLQECSSYMLVSKNEVFDKKCLFPKDCIIELEEEFGECTYHSNDFDEMKDAYYVFVNPYFQYEGTNEDLCNESGGTLHVSGKYVATIFVDDEGNLYYCNSENLIKNDMAQKIEAVLIEGNMIAE